METEDQGYEEWFCWRGCLKLVAICLVLGLALLASIGGSCPTKAAGPAVVFPSSGKELPVFSLLKKLPKGVRNPLSRQKTCNLFKYLYNAQHCSSEVT